jgi:hypothetical protein
VSAGEDRTVAELLDDSNEFAREALLDMSADRALGMMRGWPQLMQSAAELWAVLPHDPTVLANGDPIAILAAMGRAVGRSVAAGHWAGQGPGDEAGNRSHRTSCGPGSCFRKWVTPEQIRANQIIPFPEPARRGQVNAATDVAAATNQAVAAAAHLKPTEQAPRVLADGARRVGRAVTERESPVRHPYRGGPSR